MGIIIWRNGEFRDSLRHYHEARNNFAAMLPTTSDQLLGWTPVLESVTAMVAIKNASEAPAERCWDTAWVELPLGLA